METELQIKALTLETIIDHINDQTCLVILGPHLLTDKEEKSININAQLNKKLMIEVESEVTCYEEDGLLSFPPRDRNVEIKKCINNFFTDLKPNKLYENLAGIPFSTIINTAPDKTLNKVFDKKGKGYDYDYYIRIKPEGAKDELGKERIKKHTTYIYNIFGDYEVMDSMILTYEDLFNYLQSISQDHNRTIKSQLGKIETVLFFGFSFDKWYFQLLLWIMNIKEKTARMPNIKQPHIKEFYSKEFNMKFFNAKSAAAIIDQLHEAKSKGLIKEQEDILFQPKLFISYKHENKSKEMADKIEETLPDYGISLIRDEKHLTYGQMIKEFMNRINKANGAIVIISDEYLTSVNTMYELTRLYIGDKKDEKSNENEDIPNKDNTKRKKSFKNRIFPIYMTDAIFNTDEIQKYEEIWINRMKKKHAEADPTKPGYVELMNEFQVIQEIQKNFTPVIMLLKGMMASSPEELINSDFKELIELIKQRY